MVHSSRSHCGENMLSIPTAVIVVALTFSVRAFRADQEEDGVKGATEWIRLCTITSNGSSQINVTMPCGIQVHGGHNGSVDSVDKVVENARGSLNNSHGYAEGVAVVDEKNHQNPADNGNSLTGENVTASDHVNVDGEYVNEGLKAISSDDHIEEFDGADVEDEGDYEEDNVTVETQDDVTVEAQDDHVVEAQGEAVMDVQGEAAVEAQYDVTVEVQNDAPAEAQDDGYGNQELYEYQRGNMVTKVMVTYLREARNQLYNKIHYLLNLLQHAFISSKLNHRSRRHSIERQGILNNYAEGRLGDKKKGQSFSSLIMKPTFERSMMTMSFLMFGVFIIQVVQRLMQTLQQSGEHASNSTSGNLPAALSSLF